LRSLEHERRLVKRERESLAEADNRNRSREDALRQREETFKLKLNEKLDERLREARLQIDTVVAELRKQASGIQAPSTGDTGRLRGEARAALESVGEKIRRDEAAATPPQPENTRLADLGDRVLIKGLGLEGTVVMVHDREAEVDVRGKRFRAHTNVLRVVDAPHRAEPATVHVNVQVQPREHLSSELMLVGQTVDQAIDRLEKFLDESLLSDQRTLRLIHGFGTGRLREAIFEFLNRHPLVTSVRTASAEEGGGGVTIAELKD
jgi:DNA mismatch repair protein MutS2